MNENKWTQHQASQAVGRFKTFINTKPKTEAHSCGSADRSVSNCQTFTDTLEGETKVSDQDHSMGDDYLIHLPS